MPDYESLIYNISAFLCSLFVLEKGADLFVDHTAIVGRRTGIPQSLIALLTAGAEWEEVRFLSVQKARCPV
jgi:Ca2+/Na+ antiporter